MSGLKSRLRGQLRRIGRHARRVDTAQGHKEWTQYAVAAFRDGAKLERAEARKAQLQTSDILTYLDSLNEQHELIHRFGQMNADQDKYRDAAARRVGLEIPQGVPLREANAAAKYDVTAKLARLGGVKGLKAQLFGLQGMLDDMKEEKREAEMRDTGFER